MKEKALIVLCLLSSLLCGVVCAAWASNQQVQTGISWDDERYEVLLLPKEVLMTFSGVRSFPAIRAGTLYRTHYVGDEFYAWPGWTTRVDWQFCGVRYRNLVWADSRCLRALRVRYATPFLLTGAFSLLVVASRSFKPAQANGPVKVFRPLVKTTCLMLLLPLVSGMLLSLGVLQVLLWIL